MPDTHRIERIVLSNFQQFPHCLIDLRDPETGLPLEEVCFIGVNGTGKSSLLEQLHRAILSSSAAEIEGEGARILTTHRIDDESFCRVRSNELDEWYCVPSNELDDFFDSDKKKKNKIGDFCERFAEFTVASPAFPAGPVALFSHSQSLIGPDTAGEFEAFLEARLKERSAAYHDFLKLPENRSKTVEEVDLEFSQTFPGELDSLKEIWDRVLQQASLQFDPDGKGSLISSVTGNEISFSQLSLGMQNFLLRLGHVFCQYFRKEEQGSGFLFLDEPESGLHPGLQLNLVNLYRSVLSSHRAQLFIATHSPLIATQFDPDSRIVLRFNKEGHIVASRGTEEKGTESSKLLQSDFGVKSLQAAKKKKKKKKSGTPAKVSRLKEAIQDTNDQTELADLIDEVVSFRRS